MMKHSTVFINWINYLFLSIIIVCLLPGDVCSQKVIPDDLIKKCWEANWITHPDAGLKSYEVYLFRRCFNLQQLPEKFIIHVSADSRYKLFVNGKQVGLGPGRNDLSHWNYETYDIKAYLIQQQKG